MCFVEGAIKVNASYVPTESEAIKAAGFSVHDGCYEPPQCVPTQTVAIIVPYKNRQQHLITLMHHLHPVLQVKLEVDNVMVLVNLMSISQFFFFIFAEAMVEILYICNRTI